MRFEDEQYVRLYKRDTTSWLMLPWQGRCVLPLILKACDRAGIIDLGEDGWEGLAVTIKVPLEIVEAAMPEILKRKILVLRPDGIMIWPKFIEAQEAKQSDKARQKSARDRARDLALAQARGIEVSQGPAPTPDATVTSCSDTVTPRDAPSRKRSTPDETVTLSCDQQSCDQPSPPVSAGDAPVARASDTERLVDLGSARCERACEVYAATLAELGWARPPVRERWERQALCDAVNAHLRADGSADGIFAEMRRALSEWVDAYGQTSQFTQGWGARKFSEWLTAGRPRADRKTAIDRPSGARRSPEPLPSEDPADYPPPTPEEAQRLAQALRDLVSPPPAANVAPRVIGGELSAREVERLEAKRVATVKALRAEALAEATSSGVQLRSVEGSR